MLHLKWGMWELSLLRLPHPWLRWALYYLSLSLILDAHTCDRFPEPNNMALSQKRTILNYTSLPQGLFQCYSIIFLMSPLAFPVSALSLWRYGLEDPAISLSLLWPPPVNGGWGKADIKSPLSPWPSTLKALWPGEISDSLSRNLLYSGVMGVLHVGNNTEIEAATFRQVNTV